MQEAKPQAEHEWLHRLIGEWTFESRMEQSEPFTGTEGVESFGDFWIRSEGQGLGQDGTLSRWSLTLTYDPRQEKYIGTWIGSMSPHMFVYEGTRDATGNVLTLDCEGPSMTEENRTARYQDIIELVDDDHWVLRSQMLGADGTWTQFVETRYERAAANA
ncbi:DUF1579 domain-containing protein [Nocardia sp. CDC159]|uniref:DUF1579 domain-containing protein n=1 Tax=Nocardia pulmonis TaxID=2951408 RepID=A0A9X2E5U6_9NOCA|nr:MULTISPECIES: DUF1579 domain-containing protein [Nocardia]MCM6774215.1 DUF1579 domain-containing protein [Nocardia pulmonis]MCM6787102.1 DUF1579 domain-containing protein [Nocardia sp. CDC159]